VTFAVPLALPDLAVMVTSPKARGVTTPWFDTVAALLSELDQVTDAPAMRAPFWSLTVAMSCPVAPPAVRASVEGETLTVVGTGVGGGGGGVPESPQPAVARVARNPKTSLLKTTAFEAMD
jgi:hypothetical protein